MKRLLIAISSALIGISASALADSPVPALPPATSLFGASTYLAQTGGGNNQMGFLSSIFGLQNGALTINPSAISGSMLGPGAALSNIGSGSITPQYLTPTGVTAGSCTNCNLSYNAAGQLTAASNGSGGGGGTITLSGAVAGSGTSSITTTYSGALPLANLGGAVNGDCVIGSGGAWVAGGCGGSSGFPIVLGSTSVAASSTTTTLAGLTLSSPTITSPSITGTITGSATATFGAITVSSCSGCGGSSGLVVGTTTISSGTNGDIEYNNSGVLGEKGVTGTGNVVLATSPALTTPNLGTPSAATLTNATGLPVATGISGLGSGVATALAIAPNTMGGFALDGSSSNPTFGALTVTSCSGCTSGGGGTVTSVAMTVPTGFTIGGSPITTAGTLALGLSNETANTVFAGPSTGSAAAPTFRALVSADLPVGSSSQIGGLECGSGTSCSGGTISVSAATPNAFSGSATGTNSYTISALVPSSGCTLSNAPTIAASFANANTGAATLTACGGTSVAIDRQTIAGLTALGGGEIAAGNTQYLLQYNTTAAAWVESTLLGGAVTNGATSTTVTQAQWANWQVMPVSSSGQTITLPVSTTLIANGGIVIPASGNSVSIACNSADTFHGSSTSSVACTTGPFTNNSGNAAIVTSDGAGNIYANLGTSASLPSIASGHVIGNGTGSTATAADTTLAAGTGISITPSGGTITITNTSAGSGVLVNNTIAGCKTSNDSTPTVLDVTPCQAADSTNAEYIPTLAGSFTKEISGSSCTGSSNAFVSGSGNCGMFGTAATASTQYFVYEIDCSTGGSHGDIYFDTSTSAASIPSCATKYRRIGSFKTNGSTQIVGFQQSGGDFYLNQPVTDQSSVTPTTSTTYPLASLPSGIPITEYVAIVFANTTASASLSAFSSKQSGTAPGSCRLTAQVASVQTNSVCNVLGFADGTGNANQITVTPSTTGNTVSITSVGWHDSRGQ